MIHITEQEIMKNWIKLDTPRVSVCCITYKHEHFIEEAIDSFLMQKTNFPFEIIIDDDLSPDKTAAIVQEYVQKFPNIINANLRTKNVGAITNFMENIKRANGKYIAVCEGDDYWIDNLKLQKQSDVLEGDYKFYGCFNDCLILTEKKSGEITKHVRIDKRTIDSIVDIASLIKENNIATASIMFRNHDMHFPKLFLETKKGDYALMLMITEKGLIKYIPDVMTAYRIHLGGIWSSMGYIYHEEQAIHFYNALKEHFSDAHLPKEVYENIKQKLEYSNFRLSIYLLRASKRISSVNPFIKSIGFTNKHPDIIYKAYFKEYIKSLIGKSRKV